MRVGRADGQHVAVHEPRGRRGGGDAFAARHERLGDRGRTKYYWQHYILLLQRRPGALRNGAPFTDRLEPRQQIRLALLHNAGCDLLMAQEMAIVPTASLAAALVAVQLAVESAPSFGRVSVEHVIKGWEG